jgi:hypothetical protein
MDALCPLCVTPHVARQHLPDPTPVDAYGEPVNRPAVSPVCDDRGSWPDWLRPIDIQRRREEEWTVRP